MSSAWGCITKTTIAQTIALQKKTTRLICGVDSRTHCAPLARLLNILLLDDLCKFQILCIMYRVFNLSACIVLCNMFCRSNVVHGLNTHNLNFYIFPCSTNIRKNFIVKIGSKLWNNLSNIFRDSKTLCIFKKALHNNLFWGYD